MAYFAAWLANEIAQERRPEIKFCIALEFFAIWLKVLRAFNSEFGLNIILKAFSFAARILLLLPGMELSIQSICIDNDNDSDSDSDNDGRSGPAIVVLSLSLFLPHFSLRLSLALAYVTPVKRLSACNSFFFLCREPIKYVWKMGIKVLCSCM